MAVNRDQYTSDTNIYKYTASMKYVAADTVIDITSEQIRSIAIDSDYKNKNMPMLFVTASIHDDYVDFMEENQDTGIFILSIKRAVANSDMPELYTDYIEDKFIYFLAVDPSGNASHDGSNKGADFSENDDRDDLYETISIGLLSLDHINKNKKLLNGVITGGLSSIMYYITGHLPILIEPPSNNKNLENQFLPPMNSVSKALEYLNSICVFYNTPYRFFIDFDCSYLLSSSGNAVKRKGEDITTVLITIREDEDPGAKIQGMLINKEKKLYQLDVDDTDCEIADNHISGKSFSKLIATGASGSTIDKTVIEIEDSSVVSKSKNIRIRNDNTGIIDNMVASMNSSAVQMMIQKTDVDASIFTMNKEYNVLVDDVNDIYDKDRYDGKYLLTRKRELYVKTDKYFTMDLMLVLEKI